MRKLCKFGGSSLSTYKNFKKAKKIVESDENRKIVVVSAMGKSFFYHTKITDQLILLFNTKDFKLFKKIKKRFGKLARKTKSKLDLQKEFEILKNAIQNKNYEKTLAFGEYLTAKLFAEFLSFKFIDAKDVIIFDKDKQVDQVKTESALRRCAANSKVVIPGFYGCDENGNIMLMERGGSDYSAALIAKNLQVDLLEIWSDVDGLYLCSPQLVKNNLLEEKITLPKLEKLVEYGTPILNMQCVQYLKNCGFQVDFKNTFNPTRSGTQIVCENTKNYTFSTHQNKKEAFSNATICEICVLCPENTFNNFLTKAKKIHSCNQIEKDIFILKVASDNFHKISKQLFKFLKRQKHKEK